ncbi:hypothetical protein D5086_003862 [Populus alba]
MKTRIGQRSPMVLEYIESIDRTIGLKENLAHAKDSLDMFGIKRTLVEEVIRLFLKGAMVRILKWKGLPSKALSNPMMLLARQKFRCGK